MTSTSPESRSGWTLWLLLLAAVQILVLWLSSYSEGNLDDKAVHYYSAARLFAQADKTAPLDGIEHLWLNKLPADRQFRAGAGRCSKGLVAMDMSTTRGPAR